jgi:hypothetical protein
MNGSKVNSLAAAVAALTAAASLSAIADIELQTTTAQQVKLADELKGTADGNGAYTLANAGNALDVVGDALTGTPISSNRFVRYTLTNAVLNAVPTLSQVTVKAANNAQAGTAITTAAGTASIISGGAAADAYVVFQVNTPVADIIRTTDHATMAAASYKVTPGATATVTYSTHTSAIDAVNNANALATVTRDAAEISAALTASWEAINATATVASTFTSFAAQTGLSTIAAGTLAAVGFHDISDATDASWAEPDGSSATMAELVTATQVVTLTGDVSKGAFTVASNNDCSTSVGTLAAATDKASASVSVTNTEVDLWICVQLSGLATGEAIGKNSYSASLDSDGLSGAIGAISYDTTTVEAPYITTYEGYNQRIFIDNRGTAAAYYSTSFTTEAGVTATAGTAATGTLAANAISTVKVADLVTFTGGSRGAATMEIEASDGNIWVTTQIVDLGTGMTDTLVLN